jgi:uncharacterized protein YoxC
MSVDMYTEIEKKEKEGEGKESGLHWFCEGCNVGMGKIIKSFKEMEEKYEKIEGEVKRIAKRMEEMVKREKEVEEERKNDKGKLKKIDQEVRELKQCTETLNTKVEEKVEMEDVKSQIEEVKKDTEYVKKSFAEVVKREEERKEGEIETGGVGKVSKVQEEEEKKRMLELIERAKRRSNLILFGVPEEAADGEGSEIVQDIVNGLLGDGGVKYEVIGRIGRKAEKPRPLRIKVEDSRNRRRILVSAKKLKGMEGKQNIYIVPDLTREQQDEDRRKRDEIWMSRVNRGKKGVKDGERVITGVGGSGNREESDK